MNCTEPFPSFSVSVIPGKSNGRGRLSTVDLLDLTSFDQVLSILKILFTCIQNKLTELGVNGTEHFSSVSVSVIPGKSY